MSKIHKNLYRRLCQKSEGAAEFLPPTPSFRRTRADFGKDCEIALAILHEMVSSRTVKIHQNLTFCNLTNFFVGGAKRRPLIFPRQILSARRAQARLAVGQDEVRLPCDFNSVSDLLCPKLLTNQNI